MIHKCLSCGNYVDRNADWFYTASMLRTWPVCNCPTSVVVAPNPKKQAQQEVGE